jgi:uncharacterized membrane protein YjjP (DUF1212 family)
VILRRFRSVMIVRPGRIPRSRCREDRLFPAPGPLGNGREPVIEEAGSQAIGVPANKATDLIVRLGSALVAAGAPVDLVEEILTDVSRRYNVIVGYSILPTGLIVLGHEGTAITASIASTNPATLRFDQTADLFHLVDDVRAGQVDPAQGIERLAAIAASQRQAGFLLTVFSHAVLTVGLALLLNPSWRSVGVTALLGLLVGFMKLAADPHRTLVKVLPAATACLVTLLVLLMRRFGVGVDELQAMVPPLVTFLPGAMLTVGAMELAEGSIVTGSSRLVAGLMQLALLVLGIVVAAGLAHVPESAGLSPRRWRRRAGSVLYPPQPARTPLPHHISPGLLAACPGRAQPHRRGAHRRG